MIECVSLENNHLFNGNPIAAQHRLRYRSIIKRQGWGVPTVRDMEFDTYDNPATVYLIARDTTGEALGVSRLYPTDRPYMLQEVFSHLATTKLPNAANIWEGSRFCIDETISPNLRRTIIQQIIVAYLEYGLDQGIDRYIGVMYPIYWRNIFTKSGWDIDWLGEEIRLESGHAVRAGGVKVSKENLERVRNITGIHDRLISYGSEERNQENVSIKRTAA